MSNGNDMVFPILDRTQTPNETTQLGLSKREYFAGEALKGVLSNEKLISTLIAEGQKQGVTSLDCIAGSAIAYADRLLERLAK